MNCMLCKGRSFCGRPCRILESIKQFSPKIEKLDFSGSSPPDLFVGRFQYPNVGTGILAPASYDENADSLSSPEAWFKENLSVENILAKRGSLIYSKFDANIKSKHNPLLDTMQELAMATKPCSTEFILKKKPVIKIDLNARSPPIGNPAPLKKAILEENPTIPKKIDYIVSDSDYKAAPALLDLHKSDFSVTSMIKLLSAGLLGLKKQRKLTPSRWATTAVDSTISKSLMTNIRNYPWINDIQIFSDEYLGNHYEILLLPRQWSFEVIEAKVPGSCWNSGKDIFFMQDSETFWDRTTYASEVSGAYYANRLAVTEYLNSIKKQASVLFLREARKEYWAPLGVGILREVSRSAFTKQPEKFSNLKEAFTSVQKRMIIPVTEFLKRSQVIKNYKEQLPLSNYFANSMIKT